MRETSEEIVAGTLIELAGVTSVETLRNIPRNTSGIREHRKELRETGKSRENSSKISAHTSEKHPVEIPG